MSIAPQLPNPCVRRWFRARWIILPMLFLLVFALPQLFGGKMKVDSGLYAGVALQAFKQGTWWTIMAGDQPYFRKPPLVFWIHGLFLWALGANLFVLRLPTILAALGCIAMTSVISRRLANWRVALFSACVLASTVLFFHMINRFVLDYWMTLFMLAAVWLVVESQRRQLAWPAILAGVPIGCAMMCKPLTAGLMVPILFVWLLTMKDYRLAFRVAFYGGAVALLVAAPWHVSMILRHGNLFVGSYFQREMVDRINNALGFAVEPPYWYPLALLQSYWPWMLTLSLGAWSWLRRPASAPRERNFRLFCLCFIMFWLVFMSCSADKRIRYLMPMLPMLSMVSGSWLARAMRGPVRRRVMRGLEALAPIACALAAITAVLPWTYNNEAAPEWDALDAYVRAHPDERFQIGTVNVQDGGRIYFFTGVWPHNRLDPLGHELPVPSGTLLINSNDVPRTRRIAGEVVFDQGKLRIIRVK